MQNPIGRICLDEIEYHVHLHPEENNKLLCYVLTNRCKREIPQMCKTCS